MASVAILIKQELVLVIVGGVFVMEAVSVISTTADGVHQRCREELMRFRFHPIAKPGVCAPGARTTAPQPSGR